MNTQSSWCFVGECSGQPPPQRSGQYFGMTLVRYIIDKKDDMTPV